MINCFRKSMTIFALLLFLGCKDEKSDVIYTKSILEKLDPTCTYLKNNKHWLLQIRDPGQPRLSDLRSCAFGVYGL